METQPIITAAAGFLLAVLWFDLMFDVQVWRHRRTSVPEPVVGSIAAYYHRVLTTASPMGRLVGLVMVVLLVALVAQAVDERAPAWVSIISIPATVAATGLAAARVVGRARRLGARTDPPETQARLARTILTDHLICLALMSAVMATQLADAIT